MIRAPLLKVFSVAFVLNVIWEVTQSPLYEGEPFTQASLVICLIASMGDALFAVSVYLLLAFIHRDALWLRQRNLLDVGLTFLAGFAFAGLAEQLAVRLGWWQYGPGMPLVPYLGVGWSPFVQLAFLTFLSFEVTRVWMARNAATTRARESREKN